MPDGKLQTSIVIKDEIDIYNLMRFDKFFRAIIRDRKLTLFSNTQLQNSIIEEIRKTYEPEIVECILINRPSNIQTYVAGSLRIFSYLRYSLRSTSCLQKISEWIGVPIGWYSKIKIREKSILANDNCTSMFEEFITAVQKNNLVLYMRSDSIHNISVPRNLNAIKANFTRNLDTPFLKGRPTVKGEYIINPYFDYLHDSCFFQFSGHKIVKIQREKNINELKKYKKNVLYACSSKKFVPEEILIVKKLAEICMKSGVRLDILPHPSYENGSLVELNKIQNTKIVNDPINMQSSVEIFNMRKQLLGNYTTVVSTLSSILADDDINRLAELIYIADPIYVKYPCLYFREHFQRIINTRNVKMCNKLDDIFF